MTYIWVLLADYMFVLLVLFEQKIVISQIHIYSNIGRDINSLSFVVVSDLHSFGKNNKDLLKILEQKPEFVIIAGI